MWFEAGKPEVEVPCLTFLPFSLRGNGRASEGCLLTGELLICLWYRLADRTRHSKGWMKRFGSSCSSEGGKTTTQECVRVGLS